MRLPITRSQQFVGTTVKATLLFFLGCISFTAYEGTKRLDPEDRCLALIVLAMFLVGAAVAWVELRKWWNTRINLESRLLPTC
jgi:hypothetical protein